MVHGCSNCLNSFVQPENKLEFKSLEVHSTKCTKQFDSTFSSIHGNGCFWEHEGKKLSWKFNRRAYLCWCVSCTIFIILHANKWTEPQFSGALSAFVFIEVHIVQSIIFCSLLIKSAANLFMLVAFISFSWNISIEIWRRLMKWNSFDCLRTIQVMWELHAALGGITFMGKNSYFYRSWVPDNSSSIEIDTMIL